MKRMNDDWVIKTEGGYVCRNAAGKRIPDSRGVNGVHVSKWQKRGVAENAAVKLRKRYPQESFIVEGYTGEENK